MNLDPVRFTSYLPFSSHRKLPLSKCGLNLDYLRREFGGHGVTFNELGGSCIAKMKMSNGSKATMILQNGLITSYKPLMWHGGTLELLQTNVLEKDGYADIRGGSSLAFTIESNNGGSWSPSSWSLQSIDGDSDDGIQINLLSENADDLVEVRLVITLTEDSLSSELVVANSNSFPLFLNGSFITHLTVSSPEATFACGLQAADFKSSRVLESDYTIVPPKLPNPDELEGEEDDNYKNLGDAMSRIYSSAPNFFTLIDRGRRNSVSVGREGFDEVYVFSPGSNFEIYGLYSFICLGKSALLKPIVLNAGDLWRGAQYLQNPNM